MTFTIVYDKFTIMKLNVVKRLRYLRRISISIYFNNIYLRKKKNMHFVEKHRKHRKYMNINKL